MKWIFVFCLLFSASCTSQTTTLLSDNSSNQNMNIALKETPKTSATMNVQPEKEEFGYCKNYQQIELPKTNSPIGKIDFKNLTYPKIWQKGFVKLKNGCVGEDDKDALGGCEFTLESIDFVDFNGDGNDEALIEIGNFCGAGSSSFSHSYFIYQVINNNKLNLIWKIAGGPRAHCGMKGYELKSDQIILEVFSDCSLKNDGNFEDADKGHFDDWLANYYTKFVFGWTGNKFGVKSREIFPFPEKNMKDYKPLIK